MPDMAQQLTSLQSLHASGGLTGEQYEAAKNKVLGIGAPSGTIPKAVEMSRDVTGAPSGISHFSAQGARPTWGLEERLLDADKEPPRQGRQKSQCQRCCSRLEACIYRVLDQMN